MRKNWFSPDGATTNQKTQMLEMLSKLRKFYEKVPKERRKKLSRLSRAVTVKMLGKSSSPLFKAKAMENRCFLHFIVEELREAIGKGVTPRHGKILLRAGEALLGKYAIIQSNCGSREMDLEIKRKYLSLSCLFLRRWKKAGGKCVTKHHYSIHLAEQVVKHGHPSYFSTYRDESFNRVVKRMATKSHPLRFANRLLGKCRAKRLLLRKPR